MQKWKSRRNYRRRKDENGNVVAFLISIGNQDIEVSEEVFLAYAQETRREEYVDELERENTVSLENFSDSISSTDTNFQSSKNISAEEVLIQKDVLHQLHQHLEQLPLALETLTESEQALLVAHYIKGISMRSLAREEDVHWSTLEYRRNKALKKLLKFFQ